MVNKEFEAGDLVWAKMKGFPPWPARIEVPPSSPPSKKAQHYVYFFGSKNFSWILDDNIEHHSEEKIQNLTKKKYSGFQEGVLEIINESKLAPKKSKPPPKVTNDKNKEKEIISPKATKAVKLPKENHKLKDSPVTLKKFNAIPKKSLIKPKKRRLTNEDEISNSAPKSSGVNPYTVLFDNLLPSIGRPATCPLKSLLPEDNDSPPKRSNKRKKVGFIGLGGMGQGMVKNLLTAGHPVMVWNRSSDKCDSFIPLGATKASTPAELVNESDLTFSCVSDPHAVRTIVFGENGVLTGFEGCLRGDKGYIEMTSIDADTSQSIAEAITDAGMRYLEAPIIGSRKRAQDGTILILGSGDRELFNECEACFHAMSNHAYYISCEVGKSANINIITSMFLGTVYAALAEALSLTDRIKLSQSDLLEILELRGMTCGPFVEKGKAILERNFTPDTSLKHQQKDLNLALNLSNIYDQPMPVTSAANEAFKQARFIGCSDYDAAAVFHGAKY